MLRRKKGRQAILWLSSLVVGGGVRHASFPVHSAGATRMAVAAAWRSSSSSSSSSTVVTVRYRARVAYDGRAFQGFQLQHAEKPPTVQGELERVLNQRLLRTTSKQQQQQADSSNSSRSRTIKVVAAGRTDTGVHARGQAIHFDVPFEVAAAVLEDDGCLDQVCYQLNKMLRVDVTIWNLQRAPGLVTKEIPASVGSRATKEKDAREKSDEDEIIPSPSTATSIICNEEYDAGGGGGEEENGNDDDESTITTPTTNTISYQWNVLYDSTRKLYSYRLALAPVMAPLERHRRWHPPQGHTVDPVRLQRLLRHFEGTNDFRAFAGSLNKLERTLGGGAQNTMRTVYRVDLVLEDERWGHYRIDVHLKGALYKQVRTMVGTVLDVCQGRMSEADFVLLLREGPRRQENKSKPAPPEGLTLEHVHFDDPDF